MRRRPEAAPICPHSPGDQERHIRRPSSDERWAEKGLGAAIAAGFRRGVRKPPWSFLSAQDERVEEFSTKPWSSSWHLFESSPCVPSRPSEGTRRRKQGGCRKYGGVEEVSNAVWAEEGRCLQTGGVYEDSLDNKTDRREIGERGKGMRFHKDMHLIRTGMIPEGGKLIAGHKEINLCFEPPRNNRNMLLAKDTLNKEISQLMMSYELDHKEDVKVVKNWVLKRGTLCSAIHEDYHSEDRCDEIQSMIDSAMKHLRKLNLSIIPKLHGMEAHLVKQLKLVGWGFGLMVEHWVEHYHQVGYRYDISYCRLGSLEKQAGVRSRLEKRGRHPKVRMNRKRLGGLEKERQHKNKKSEEKARVKEEMREKAVVALEAKLVRLGDKKLNFLAALDELDEVDAL
ncbi:hypothetical protein THAOC_33210 [Thalassiosira oceanica]|uniref:Uncharacterized protein n=1 Tax=Thalassiosira oceanica TaxID=159749 RepID=K0RGF3_THAOC|nr:hypothetical protein THAOC_33210 [Thalassiosira oceanica]|eukprot:EJK48031.1 hypothetical protein THAOC_33210 [Thalassiosira oceanica]